MATLPDYDDLRRAAITEALTQPTPLTREIMETDGSEVGTAISIGAAMAEEVAVYGQATINETRLATAASQGDEALEQWVASQYGFTRQGPTSSVVTLVWRRQPSANAVTIPRGFAVMTPDGQTFETEDDVVIPGSGQARGLAVSRSTGLSTNVAANTITIPQGELPDSTITVTNTEPAAGGGPGQSLEEFQALAQGFFEAAPRGTRAAILHGALRTPGVAQANVTEFLDSHGWPNGRVQIVITGPNSQANRALAGRVIEQLEEYRGLGVPCFVGAGQPVYVQIVISGLQFAAGSSTAKVLDQARRSIVSAINRLQPGQTLEQALIVATLKGVDGLIVPHGAVIEPAGDIVPQSNIEVLRTTLDRVLLNQ